jgi:hypothetical protein
MNAARRGGLIALGLTIAAIPLLSFAHVKWFCSSANPAAPPLPFAQVLTPVYLACLAGFSLALFLGTFADHVIVQRWPRLVTSGSTVDAAGEKLMRVAVGAFFLCLWDKGAVVPWAQGEAILTPELVSGAAWISVLQFAIAVAVLWRRSCVLAAVGISVIYGAGIVDYGLFHMVDYLFFPGIAAYLALTSSSQTRFTRWRVGAVCAFLSASLMWTATEKFVYPLWTITVLIAHPSITAGIAPSIVTVIAGFVEFSLAFFLVAGYGLLRLGSAIFLAIFAAAVPEFGHLDAVGHFTIVGIFGLVCLHGASPLQRSLRPLKDSAAGKDSLVTVAFFLGFLTLFFVAYYGLHALQYGIA